MELPVDNEQTYAQDIMDLVDYARHHLRHARTELESEDFEGCAVLECLMRAQKRIEQAINEILSE